jgi:hypothetical protein
MPRVAPGKFETPVTLIGAIKRLPKTKYNIVSLFYGNGLTTKEVGAMPGLGEMIYPGFQKGDRANQEQI